MISDFSLKVNSMNSLVQEGLLGTKHIADAAIIKQKDGQIKAKSQRFTILPDELTKIQNIFSSQRATDTLIQFQEVNYRAIRADKQSIYAKNVQGISL